MLNQRLNKYVSSYSMNIDELILKSRLHPPQRSGLIYYRPRLEVHIQYAFQYPLTLVQAATGYGKTHVLAALADLTEHIYWYTLREVDRDPLRFMANFISAFCLEGCSWGERMFDFLEKAPAPCSKDVLDYLISNLEQELSAESVIVLDDFYLVKDIPEVLSSIEYLVDNMPPLLHLVVAVRQRPCFRNMTSWLVKNKVSVIDEKTIEFNFEEIKTLFDEIYIYSITVNDAKFLKTETGGWAMALYNLRLALKTMPELSIIDAFEDLTVFDLLFDYLKTEVFDILPKYVQNFLYDTALLFEISPKLCQALGVDNADLCLRELVEQGIFIQPLSIEVYQYQPIFKRFLKSQILPREPELVSELYLRAAKAYEKLGRIENAIGLALEGKRFDYAAFLIEDIGPDLIQEKKTMLVSDWIERIPESYRNTNVGILFLLSDIALLQSNTEIAQDNIERIIQILVEQKDLFQLSKAKRKLAEIYYNSGLPTEAENLLEDLLIDLKGSEDLQEIFLANCQLAELRLHLGLPVAAKELLANLKGPPVFKGYQSLFLKVLIRSGRLSEARQLLQSQLSSTGEAAFDYGVLMRLAWLDALEGNGDMAVSHAQKAVKWCCDMTSLQPDMAYCYIQLGHGLQGQVIAPWDKRTRQESLHVYGEARKLMFQGRDNLQHMLELNWGLCRLHGYSGELYQASQIADQLLTSCLRVQDFWWSGMTQLVMGSSYVMAGMAGKARQWLACAYENFTKVSDHFGQSAVLLWQSLNMWQLNMHEEALGYFTKLLQLSKINEYDFLLTRCTLLGLHDKCLAIPMIIESRDREVEKEYCENLLLSIGQMPNMQYHPGYTLWVQTFGQFIVYFGNNKIRTHEWGREKAKQLFQYLVTLRGRMISREQIIDRLWPELSVETGKRDFRVALHSLNNVIEPERSSRIEPFYIKRDGEKYGVNFGADLKIDLDWVDWQIALDTPGSLYRGLDQLCEKYLPDVYADWADSEIYLREQQFFEISLRLARKLLVDQEWNKAVDLCQSVIMKDNLCEEAYLILMEIYAGQDNYIQVLNTYKRCEKALLQELGVAPSSKLSNLLARMKQQNQPWV